LIVEFDRKGRGHDDITLRLDGYERKADSYYFAIDWRFDRGDESPHKAGRCLSQLLQAWIAALEKSAGAYVFLPYDLSDGYTGCLRCNITGESVEIMPGFSTMAGAAVSPSNPGNYFTSVPGFGRDLPQPIVMRLDDFICRVRGAISALNDAFAP
jgi:hypothetical protein